MPKGHPLIIPDRSIYTEQLRLQRRLLDAVTSGNEKDVDVCRSAFERLFPYDSRGVSILFEMVDVLKTWQSLAHVRTDGPEDSLKLLDKSAYGAELERYLVQHGENRAFLETFWKFLEKISKAAGVNSAFDRLRKNVMTEVAAYRSLAALGLDPRPAAAYDDVFHFIDLTIRDNAEYVQVKGAISRKPFALSYEYVSGVRDIQRLVTRLPVPRTRKSIKFWMSTIKKFKASTESLHMEIGRTAHAHLIAIPYTHCDAITCRPAPVVIEYFKEYFG